MSRRKPRVVRASAPSVDFAKSMTVQTGPWNSWQMTSQPKHWEPGSYGPVYACWRIISDEISRIALRHAVTAADGSVTFNTSQAPARVFRRPNRYQTQSDFLLYIAYSLLSDGNAYGRIIRNGRFEISEIYPVNPRMCHPHIDMTTGDVYYQVSDSNMRALARVDDFGWVPERDMLHVRLFTPVHPLIGETPLVAAALSVNAGASINSQVAGFFSNMARPSGIVRTPKTLEPAAVERIKERFRSATSDENIGKPVVLTEGMTWEAMTMNAVDAELIASAKLSQTQVAQIYRVPPFMLGDMEGSKFSTVESMTRWFINSCLGFYLNHISNSLTRSFALPMGEEVEFDQEGASMRADFKEFMTALGEGTRSAVLSPNEARAKYRLPPVADGDVPRMQQQMVPLSYGAAMQPPSTVPAPDPTAKAVRIELMRRRMLGEAA
jgi:HK97 family phage portal protein